MKLLPNEFSNLQSLINETCGLAIPEEKHYLIQQRLEPLAVETGCNSYDELYQMLKLNNSKDLLDKFITMITTHETSFFRDEACFESFSKLILPDLMERVKARKDCGNSSGVRIWSAASSTGQEAYSIAMLVRDYIHKNRRENLCVEDFSILGTDISTDVIHQAIAGEYNSFEIQRGLSDQYRNQYFGSSGSKWIIKDEIRDMVQFKNLNLVDSFNLLGTFDVIFCRNVLIYFDDEVKKQIFKQFSQLLMDDGYLILGSSENAIRLTDDFESFRQDDVLLYRKKKKRTYELPQE